MTAAERIVEQAIGNLEEKGTGIFVKHLRNGAVYTCRCPVCSSLHGGFDSFAEAQLNLKCRLCHRNEIEKMKKEIAKVDDPEPQKDIFKNPLKKHKVIEGMDNPEDFKDIAGLNEPDESDPADNYIGYNIYWAARLSLPVTDKGRIGQVGFKRLSDFKPGCCRIVGVFTPPDSRRHAQWPEIKRRLDRGETITGRMLWYQKGSYTNSDQTVTISKIKPVYESKHDYEDEDTKTILGDIPLSPDAPTEVGEVNKLVCTQAHYGQEFFSRLERDHRGYPKRVRVSGKCKTWSTRQNEFRLPVKFGLYQSFYITDRNASDFSTVPLAADGTPIQ